MGNSVKQAKIYHCDAIYDPNCGRLAADAIVVSESRILAVGLHEDIAPQFEAAEPVDLRGHFITPGFVNAHVHLDISMMDAKSFPGSFTQWLIDLRTQWAGITEEMGEAEAFAASSQRGVAMSLDAGVVCVGDIACTEVNANEMAIAGLSGVSFLELIGVLMDRFQSSVTKMERWANEGLYVSPLVKRGLQPHAPYSTRPALFRKATELAKQTGMPLSTHLSETPEEAEFIARATGPFRDFLEKIDRWDEDYLRFTGMGNDPVNWAYEYLEQQPYVLGHCNYLMEDQIRVIKSTKSAVVMCPTALRYFGHQSHPYRELMQAGVNVALGTDSVLAGASMSIFDEMRKVYAADGTDAMTLLKMGTVNGRTALGYPVDASRIDVGLSPGLVAIRNYAQGDEDPLDKSLRHKPSPQVQLLEPSWFEWE